MLIIISILVLSNAYFGWYWWKRFSKAKKYRATYLAIETPVEECYVDKFGNRWFKYADYTKLPARRCAEGNVATRHAEICMTPEMFDKYMDGLQSLMEKKDWQKSVFLIQRMKERRTFAAEEKTLQDLANVYFLLEGEDPKDTSQLWYERKKEIWAEDKDCYAFFLQSAFSTMRGFKDLSNSGLLSYLQNQAQEEAMSALS